MSEVTVLVLPPRFDFQHHVAFTANYENFFVNAAANTLQLNFSQVTYLDTSALGMLMLLAKKHRALGASGGLEIIGALGSCREMLEIANMSNYFDIK
ncbi:MAG: STAS domain-containing protein [Reinekea forsetii]|jgi:anti-anti-sigma regulatory factor|nr:STAS domain-containing protein [Reinekea forsetii]